MSPSLSEFFGYTLPLEDCPKGPGVLTRARETTRDSGPRYTTSGAGRLKSSYRRSEGITVHFFVQVSTTH